MKLEAVRREVESSGTMQTARATIKATPKIFSMFADDTYTNKPLAIMRELVANGVDAHVMGNTPDVPVEVVLPTALDPTCVVRDHGIGMSREFIMGDPDKGIESRFMAYTDGSTKDGDDKAIGGFGIGSKAPLSYVDQFTLRVVHDGVLSVYTLFKGIDGIPEIGLQAETTTDEHNGVEISFPVEIDDIERFHTAAQEALQYFVPLPVVTNGTLNPPAYNYVGKKWMLRKSAGELGVIMGGVRYPTTAASMSYDLRNDSRVGPLLKYGIDIIRPIGAANVAMSREALSYTDKTSESIKAALHEVIDEVVATFATYFDKEVSLWDAQAKLYEEISGPSSNRSGRTQLMAGNAKYKGNKLETGFQLKDNNLGRGKVERYRSSKKNQLLNLVPVKDLYMITPGDIKYLIIDDLPTNKKSKTASKIQEAFAYQQGSILFLRAGQDDENVDPVAIQKLLDALGNPTKYTLTSSLPEPAVLAKPDQVRPKVRMWTFDGSRNAWTNTTIDNLTPAYGKSGVVEIDYANQPATGILVEMDSFKLPEKFYGKMGTGLIAYSELHFTNVGDAAKIKKNWKTLDEVFDERLKKALAAAPHLAEALAVYHSRPLSNYFRFISGLKLQSALAGKKPFQKMTQLYFDYIKSLTDNQQKLAPFVTPTLPKGLNDVKLIDDFKKEQADAYLISTIIHIDNSEHRALFLKNL